MRIAPSTVFAAAHWLLLAGLLAGCGKSSDPLKGGKRITGSQSDPPVLLQVRWSPTNRYYYRVETTLYNDIITKTKMVPVAQETILALEYSIQVAQTNDDGSRRFALEILSAALNLSRNGELLVSYDTENRAFMLDDADFAPTLRNIKGGRLTFTVSLSNTVEKIEGVSALLARIGASNTGALKTVAYLKSASMLRGMLTDDFFRQLVEWNFFPDYPVRIGQSWPSSRRFATNPIDRGSGTAELTCKFKGWQEHSRTNCAVVDFTGPTKGVRRVSRGLLGWFSSEKPSMLQGRLWHQHDHGLPITLICWHESTTQYSSGSRVQPDPAAAADTNAPAASAKASGSVFTLATRQFTAIEFLEVGPFEE